MLADGVLVAGVVVVAFPLLKKENARLLAGYQLAGEILNTSQFRRLTVLWFAGSLLKETGMVNPPVRRGNQRVGIWDNRGFRCWY